jgi:hypothetical protein
VADLDAVLPLASRDLERAQILLRTLERFFEPLARLWVVVPDCDRASIRLPFGEVVTDSEIVPELDDAEAPHGWYVQQLVKLAIADRIETPFYLTLDGDVICVRPTRYDDLVVGGRALAQITKPHHPEWNDDAERILALPRSPRQHGVTPAVLARDGVRALQRHLGADWRARLLRELPWTEYALYHTFLEGVGRWDDLHVSGGDRCIYGNNVWLESQWRGWHPKADGRYCFSVVQSATRASARDVWALVEPYLATHGSTAAVRRVSTRVPDSG